VSATDQLSARLPTRDEAAQLFIRPDTPVLHLLHIGFDGAHKPIEVAQATWPGPMTSLVETYLVETYLVETYPVPGPLDETDPGLSLD
jgi:GntR family transcriptional regulator